MKHFSRRRTAVPLALFLASTLGLTASDSPVTTEAADSLDKLKQGNARYVAEPMSQSQPTAERRVETATTQHPFAIVVGCADSRTAPELIFDQGIGDLFVIRSAGNLVDDYALGSIEYAVEHLGTRLIVVLGHERCGAVSAAVSATNAPAHVGAIVRDMQPTVDTARNTEGDVVQATVEANARAVAESIRHKAELGEAGESVNIVSAWYDLDTGVVTWLE